MIHIKSYRVFESMQDGVTSEQRELLNASCQIYQKNGQLVNPEDAWSVDPGTGLVNVGGNFVLDENWKGGLLGIKFGEVRGYFNVIGAGLEDASELPRKVGSHLNIDDNKFRTLEGIGIVKKSITADNNLFVSLEGATKELLGDFSVNFLPMKFEALAGNPVRSAFLRGDLEDVLRGEKTWTEIYLDIVSGEYAIKKDLEGSIEWIFKNKLSPQILGAEIKKAPAKMSISLAKVPQNQRKILNGILDEIKDLPPGFREDTDLVTDLSDIGL